MRRCLCAARDTSGFQFLSRFDHYILACAWKYIEKCPDSSRLYRRKRLVTLINSSLYCFDVIAPIAFIVSSRLISHLVYKAFAGLCLLKVYPFFGFLEAHHLVIAVSTTVSTEGEIRVRLAIAFMIGPELFIERTLCVHTVVVPNIFKVVNFVFGHE